MLPGQIQYLVTPVANKKKSVHSEVDFDKPVSTRRLLLTAAVDVFFSSFDLIYS